MNRVFSCLCFVVVVPCALVALPSLAQSRSPDELGLDLVPGSRKLEGSRYASGRDYDGTLKYFREKYRGQKSAIRWSREVTLPTVKYVHIENTTDSGAWQGVNIYQLKSGEVRIFVLPRATAMTSTTSKKS
jgi:hypothetical protein